MPSSAQAPTKTSKPTPADADSGPPAQKPGMQPKNEDQEELVGSSPQTGLIPQSEEDQQLKNELEMLVERLKVLHSLEFRIYSKESNSALYKPALEQLKTYIRTSTSSMTAVPKPLKFLRPHYADMIGLYESWPDSANKHALADVLSVLGMTFTENGKRQSLKYRLLGGNEDPTLWGHEYVRHLAAEIAQEHTARMEKEEGIDDLMSLVLILVPFFLGHNAEHDAVDLLLELESIDRIVEFVDKNTFERVCLYMVGYYHDIDKAELTTSCVSLLAPPDDVQFLRTAHEIYRRHGRIAQALSLAIRLDDLDLIHADFESTTDRTLKRQLAFMLSRQQIWIESEDEELSDCLRNTKLHKYFHKLADELNIQEPKLPEDIYKSHLENTRPSLGAANIDSAKQNLAATFVNAFVNAGFGKDKLILVEDEKSPWIFKNKNADQMSAAGSIGLLHLWNPDEGLQAAEKYQYSSEDHIKGGSALAMGISLMGVRDENDPGLAILGEWLEAPNMHVKTGAIAGLGFAYAGSQRQEVLDLLLPIVGDSAYTMQLSGFAALALGQVFVGSCNDEISSTILQTLMEREEKALKDKYGRFMSLGLALLFLGKQDAADVTIETLKAVEHPIARQSEVLVDISSYAGTGNVLKIQSLLHLCNAHIDGEDDHKDDLFQGFAVLGIAMIAMGEEVGAEMALRQFSHLMHYGEPVIRKAVPLALGLISASNPQIKIIDTLSRLSHDSDIEVAINAIFAMGMIGAGTNNARLAQLLRQLASYYSREANALFMVRIAQVNCFIEPPVDSE
ncbi:26S proteasome regulatory subunit rpn1 [Neolecta irregularis DAH-3]|uniref:26S proteasome regulatory subunit RPN1 n=1 Tax=Neolecta irregularis (strain DAH-3) TaxID=1198029 RepID=A0A1U7LKD3_NEOID|nr:26S proteasome regulatory subunit rpn1 [Neolecta irregularis DAH-3]|eukprot:OLL23053.1 26S proteasome regulatory subunit rpn1 [Neolecta irregularis DAH-3]